MIPGFNTTEFDILGLSTDESVTIDTSQGPLAGYVSKYPGIVGRVEDLGGLQRIEVGGFIIEATHRAFLDVPNVPGQTGEIVNGDVIKETTFGTDRYYRVVNVQYRRTVPWMPQFLVAYGKEFQA